MGRQVKNLVGMTFGRWKVLELGTREGKITKWICECECGKVKQVLSSSLIAGESKSCGCLSRELASERRKIGTTHNMTHTRVYRTYWGMKSRCSATGGKFYKGYAGKGIKVCDEWKNDFMKFYNWAMENGYSDELTIDRIDNDGNYEPSNCKFSNRIEQQNNQSTNRFIEWNGISKTASRWSAETGISRHAITNRIKHGWDVERALTEPCQPRKRRKIK